MDAVVTAANSSLPGGGDGVIHPLGSSDPRFVLFDRTDYAFFEWALAGARAVTSTLTS